jgi:hypothetical protein
MADSVKVKIGFSQEKNLLTTRSEKSISGFRASQNKSVESATAQRLF